jgi:hypothetical protein
VRSGPAEKARKFEDYLGIAWRLDPVDVFTQESGLNLIKAPEHKVESTWKEIGQLGGTTFRSVKYLVDGASWSCNYSFDFGFLKRITENEMLGSGSPYRFQTVHPIVFLAASC